MTETICVCVACQNGSKSGNYGRQAHSGRCEGSSSQQNNENCCCCLETAPTQSSSTMPFQPGFGKVCYQDILHAQKSKWSFSGRHDLSKQPLETLSQCRDGPGHVLVLLAPSSSSASPPPRGQPALTTALPPSAHRIPPLPPALPHLQHPKTSRAWCPSPSGLYPGPPRADQGLALQLHYIISVEWNFSPHQDPEQLCLGLI